MPAETVGSFGPDRPRLAVTTRSRLKSPDLFLPVLEANSEIKAQLAEAPGCLRYASVVMGSRDTWSISLWRSRWEMLAFMRTGPHERFMWNVMRSFDWFWLMRWAPTDDEIGSWDGLRSRREGPPRVVVTNPAQDERDKRALDSFPYLPSVGPEGAPTFDSAPAVRMDREQVEWASGGIVRLRVDGPDAPGMPGLPSLRSGFTSHETPTSFATPLVPTESESCSPSPSLGGSRPGGGFETDPPSPGSSRGGRTPCG